MTMGFPVDFNKLELTDSVHKHMQAVKPIPHKIVETGPVFENIITGKDIDVTKFPTPKWHEEEAEEGRQEQAKTLGDVRSSRDPLPARPPWMGCAGNRQASEILL